MTCTVGCNAGDTDRVEPTTQENSDWTVAQATTNRPVEQGIELRGLLVRQPLDWSILGVWVPVACGMEAAA
jgi:hypothetical protein